MIKEDVLQYLKDNFYLASTPTGLVITNKFTRELGIPSSNTVSIASSTLVKPVLKPTNATKEVYKQFIMDANVPSKIDTSNGSYWANRYSESGFKGFAKVWNNVLINRTVLLAATKWYYAQTRTARKMIGTYFSEGIWESCYDDFVKARAKHIEGKTEDMLKNMKPLTMSEPKDENESNTEYR